MMDRAYTIPPKTEGYGEAGAVLGAPEAPRAHLTTPILVPYADRRASSASPATKAVGTDRLRSRVTSLHTLGPAGTNCELAARTWFQREGRPGEVVLHPTLEAAADAALELSGAALMACIAYPELHTLLYSRYERLTLIDCLIIPTHGMVLATRKGVSTITSVACHPAPVTLVPDGVSVTFVDSNSRAAQDCIAGLVDGCITTEAAMEAYGLELAQDFGPLSMGFTVHAQREVRPSGVYC